MYDYPKIEEVVQLLGLERKPRGTSFKVRCPFCGDHLTSKGTIPYAMDINSQKGTYFCFDCETGGGLLDLYGRVALGTPMTAANKKELFKALQKARGESSKTYVSMMKTPQKPVEEYKMIYPAKDERLNEVYQALLSLPELSLSDDHRQNLLSRGLADESIDRNGYRTIPDDNSWVRTCYHIRAAYEAGSFEKERKSIPAISRIAKNTMIASMLIGETVKAKVGDPERIPGFFKLCGRWFFRMEAGMLIPTRNVRGEIVAFQIRKDKGDVRYLTLSSKGLPEGVNTRIARAHFPISNAAFDEKAVIMITEGPLKSDVAIELMKQMKDVPYSFIAIPGVQTRHELPGILTSLKKHGVRRIYNAFDMDRLLNPTVIKATEALKKECLEQGIKLLDLYWDEDAGRQKKRELQKVFEDNGISCELDEPWYETIPQMCLELHNRNIPYCRKPDNNGGYEKDYWPDCSKGIDDYLKSLNS